MATKKTYFQGLGELVNNPELEKFQEKEFAEKLPTEAFLGDDEKLSESSTSRRDFLKFLGFSTAAASLASASPPASRGRPGAAAATLPSRSRARSQCRLVPGDPL